MKFVLLKRKALSLIICLLCAVAMFCIVSHPAVIGAAITRQLPIYCVQRDQKVTSLSFDTERGNIRVRQPRSSQITTAHSGEWAVVIWDRTPEKERSEFG